MHNDRLTADRDFYQIVRENKTFHFTLALMEHKDAPGFITGLGVDYEVYDASGKKCNPNRDAELMCIVDQLHYKLEKSTLECWDGGFFDFFEDRGHLREIYRAKKYTDRGNPDVMPLVDSEEGMALREELFGQVGKALKDMGARQTPNFLFRQMLENPHGDLELELERILEPHIFQPDVRAQAIAQIAPLMERMTLRGRMRPQLHEGGFSVRGGEAFSSEDFTRQVSQALEPGIERADMRQMAVSTISELMENMLSLNRFPPQSRN